MGRAALLAATGALLAAGGDATPASKPVTKPFKIASIDEKARRIEVKETGYEVLWHETKTRFYHHRTVQLRDLPDDTALEIFGKRHEDRSDDRKAGGKRTDPLFTDVELIGTGAAFQRPALEAKAGGVAWEKAKLAAKKPFSVAIEKKKYRLAGDDRLTAYSLEAIQPGKIPAGSTLVIRGNTRKVTVERDGKPVEVTRISAIEVHLVELSAEHARVFQSQWVERKKEPGAGAKGETKDEKRGR